MRNWHHILIKLQHPGVVDYFKIYVFNLKAEPDSYGGAQGNVQGIGIHRVALYKERNNIYHFPMAHEVCHGLGLHHAFSTTNNLLEEPDQKYVF